MNGFSGKMGVTVTVLDTTNRPLDAYSFSMVKLFDVAGNGFTTNQVVVAKRFVNNVENYMMGVSDLGKLILGLLERSDGLETTSLGCAEYMWKWPKRKKHV